MAPALPLKKILILGISGAGKSTLAVKLGELLSLPVIHLDSHFWKPGWVPTPRDQWMEKVGSLVAKDEWIMDGNFDGSLHVRIPEADGVIYMDFPVYFGIWRVLKRWISYYGKVRPDIGPGCPEKMDVEFIKWILDFKREVRPGMIKSLYEAADQKKVTFLRTPKDVEYFLSIARAWAGIH